MNSHDRLRRQKEKNREIRKTTGDTEDRTQRKDKYSLDMKKGTET